MKYQLVFTKQAVKDSKKLSSAGLRPKAEKLLEINSENPFQNPPPYATSPREGQVGLCSSTAREGKRRGYARVQKLTGDLTGYYSRRINIQHRLVYQVLAKEKVVKVLRLWTHYE